MTFRLRLEDLVPVLPLVFVLGTSILAFGFTETRTPNDRASNCRIEAVDFKGWQAQRLANDWVQLVVVPQNGGRLMQVTFSGHSYLFVNPKYAGKYLPPTPGQWFNYGGDKLWLLPEGNKDEQHWAGDSDLLDDGPFSFRKVSEGQRCEIELTSPADTHTGVQFIRKIAIEGDSPKITFNAVMKNVSGHSLEWSMQSVSQYDTADPNSASRRNPDFWTFTSANRASSYLNRYHVRFGPAENPSASVREDGLFALQYAHLAAELWLDSLDGWLAVVDGTTQYAMVERFQYEPNKSYPGKASVIFWTNGPEVKVNDQGEGSMTAGNEGVPPYYLEAEINSPLCRLRAGESCNMLTEWYPTRVGKEFHGVTDAGLITSYLTATRLQDLQVALSGTFGVFYPGRLVAHFYNDRGLPAGTLAVTDVSPGQLVSLQKDVTPSGDAARVSLHLEDENGIDRGSLGEVLVTGGAKR